MNRYRLWLVMSFTVLVMSVVAWYAYGEYKRATATAILKLHRAIVSGSTVSFQAKYGVDALGLQETKQIVQAINSWGTVGDLYFINVRIDKPALLELGKLGNINGLDLQGTGLDDETGKEMLAGLSLAGLSIYDEKISGACLAAIEKIDGLKSLMVGQTLITREQIDSFRERNPSVLVYWQP